MITLFDLQEAYTDKDGTIYEDRHTGDYKFSGWRAKTTDVAAEGFSVLLEVEFQRKFDTCDPRDYRIEVTQLQLNIVQTNYLTKCNNTRFFVLGNRKSNSLLIKGNAMELTYRSKI